MKFKILYESYGDDLGTYGFLAKSDFLEFKKVNKKLVYLLDKYDETIDSIENSADTEEKQDLLEGNKYYKLLIKTYSDNYETILSLDDAFKNNSIKIDKFNPTNDIVINLKIYDLQDLYNLLYTLQDTLNKVKDNISLNENFLMANEKPEEKEKYNLDAVQLKKLSRDEIEEILDNAGDGSTISNIYDTWWAEQNRKEGKIPIPSIVEKHVVVKQNYYAPIATKYYDEEWTVGGRETHKFDLSKIIKGKSKYYIVSAKPPTLNQLEKHRQAN